MIDILTTTIRPEMMDLCRWLWGRQDGVESNHIIRLQPELPRRRAIARMVAESEAEFFIIADDDDYVPPWFLRYLWSMLEDDEPCFGVIPERYYLMSGAYGESRSRPLLFQVFTIYRYGTDPFEPNWKGDHSTGPIIMRGIMEDPYTANTVCKNIYSKKHWNHLDPDHRKLREWLADDPEAFERYMEFT